LPRLYEKLICGYRWACVELNGYRLLANPAGPGLGMLYESMRGNDPAIFDGLAAQGFVPFAKGPDLRHDPICFALARRRNGDCPIVRFDHEAILTRGKPGPAIAVADSFRELTARTIAAADASVQA
jgi:hypothetical protein